MSSGEDLKKKVTASQDAGLPGFVQTSAKCTFFRHYDISELAARGNRSCGEPASPEGINNFILFLKELHFMKNALCCLLTRFTNMPVTESTEQ